LRVTQSDTLDILPTKRRSEKITLKQKVRRPARKTRSTLRLFDDGLGFRQAYHVTIALDRINLLACSTFTTSPGELPRGSYSSRAGLQQRVELCVNRNELRQRFFTLIRRQ
jgi:hypothetical protein